MALALLDGAMKSVEVTLIPKGESPETERDGIDERTHSSDHMTDGGSLRIISVPMRNVSFPVMIRRDPGDEAELEVKNLPGYFKSRIKSRFYYF